MDERALPSLNITACYLNNVIIADMKRRKSDSSSDDDRSHEPLPQYAPPRVLAHWLPTHQRDVIDTLQERVGMLATPDVRHMWHKAVRILPTLGDPLYWIERNKERSIAGLTELDAHKLDFYEVLVQPDRDLWDVLAAVCRILLFVLPTEYRQI